MLIDKIEALTRDTIDKFVIQKIEQEIKTIKDELNNIKNKKEDIIVANITKNETIIGGKIYSSIFNMPESYNLLKIGLNVGNYNENYVKKNGKLYSSINSLNNYKLQKDIKKELLKRQK